MAVSKDKRQTICIWDGTWQKYCKLKRKHLLEYGKPEISFTEFANACIQTSNITVSQLLDARKQHMRSKYEEKLRNANSDQP